MGFLPGLSVGEVLVTYDPVNFYSFKVEKLPVLHYLFEGNGKIKYQRLMFGIGGKVDSSHQITFQMC